MSVGVTVDSYVVYFERLKDDVAVGQDRSDRRSTEASPAPSARSSPPTSSSLIGAAILWYLTVGSVRGFAFFLGLSTLLDLVVAYFFTRPAVILLGRSRAFTEADASFGVTTARPWPCQEAAGAVTEDRVITPPRDGQERSIWHRLYHGETTYRLRRRARRSGSSSPAS